MTLVLGIESTCDDTGCAVVRDGVEILSNVVSSQIDIHNAFGGVVPELASRHHIDIIIPVIQKALEDANVTLDDIGLFAVAKGPGLIGSLLIGLNAAKALAFATKKPFVGVNHVEAHLYAAMMPAIEKLVFPLLGVVISGGHTFLARIDAIGEYTIIGTTVDDAIGEAFDKAAKIMGLPYPGGPEIEKLAINGDASRYDFKPSKIKGRPFAFSFSGLKTKVLYTVKGQSSQMKSPLIIEESDKKHVAAAFQEAAFSDIIAKASLALEKYPDINGIVFGGGVTNNDAIRDIVAKKFPETPVFWPARALTQDNAAMIAGLGYHHYSQEGDALDLEPMTRLALEDLDNTYNKK